MNRDRIRAIFLANGFTIKEGQTDLKPYVYDAAYALLAQARENLDGLDRYGHIVGYDDVDKTPDGEFVMLEDARAMMRRPCDLPPAGWRCTREKGHDGPCAAVATDEKVAEWFGVDPSCLLRVPPPPGSQVDPSMALPHRRWTDEDVQAADAAGVSLDGGRTWAEHADKVWTDKPRLSEREMLRHLDGAKWVPVTDLEGRVKWIPATPEDAAMLEAFTAMRAARLDPPEALDQKAFAPRPYQDGTLYPNLTNWTTSTEYKPGDRIVDLRRADPPSRLKQVWQGVMDFLKGKKRAD